MIAARSCHQSGDWLQSRAAEDDPAVRAVGASLLLCGRVGASLVVRESVVIFYFNVAFGFRAEGAAWLYLADMIG
jgi:hypothetical protein